eukprot:1958015-Pleurochrysis_carterae.AAC.1
MARKPVMSLRAMSAASAMSSAGAPMPAGPSMAAGADARRPRAVAGAAGDAMAPQRASARATA